jgi:hypothetical protein
LPFLVKNNSGLANAIGLSLDVATGPNALLPFPVLVHLVVRIEKGIGH